MEELAWLGARRVCAPSDDDVVGRGHVDGYHSPFRSFLLTGAVVGSLQARPSPHSDSGAQKEHSKVETLVVAEEWEQQRRRRLGEVYRVLLALEERAPDAIRTGEPGAPGAEAVVAEVVTTSERS